VFEIVLPCLDEAAALPWVLDRIPAGARAIVVDNGSTDGSGRLAAELGAAVVACAQRGYGAACQAGLLAAQADVVAFCDCDCSIDPGELPRLAEPVLAGLADLVVGRRRPARRGCWPVHARLANRVLAGVVRRRTGVGLLDLGPVRVARREALLALDVRDRRSGYPLETVLRAASAGWRIAQRDVAYLPRAGRSKVTGTVQGTVRAVKDMRAVLAP
jgi:glycosyltransferase involved in cell wall biosynthesis